MHIRPAASGQPELRDLLKLSCGREVLRKLTVPRCRSENLKSRAEDFVITLYCSYTDS
jgi:hypothetical protein